MRVWMSSFLLSVRRTGVGRLGAPAPSCYRFCPYFPLRLFSCKCVIGARARLDAEWTSRTCMCGVVMIRACAQNRTLGFTTVTKKYLRDLQYVRNFTMMHLGCLWPMRFRCRGYGVEYVSHLGLVGEASIRGEVDHGQRQDEQAQLCGHDSSRSSESLPASRHRIKADKQLNGAGITCWSQENYPTRAVPLFPLLAAAAATRGGLAGWTGTFQIAGKAEPSRNRQRAAVDKYRSL